MKKILIISLLGLTILAIPVFIIMQQRANDHRVAAITAHHSALEAVFLANGVSAQDITRQEGCARTQEKYGEGSKYCGRDLIIGQTGITLLEARNLFGTIQNYLRSASPTVSLENKNNELLQQKSKGASAVTGYIFYGLDGTTHCNTDAQYTSTEIGDDAITATSSGDLQLRIGCQDNSWWLRTFGG